MPLNTLLLDSARAVNLSAEPELQPQLRTMGIGTKSYKSGWFKLRNSSNAFVHITDPTSQKANEALERFVGAVLSGSPVQASAPDWS